MAQDIYVPINPSALEWAIRRARLSAEGLARAAGAGPDRVRAWLAGRARPTYQQATKIARKLHVSLGQLLVEPPERVELPIPHFRRGTHAQDEPSPELLEIVYDALRKRDWWREYRADAVLPFVGSIDWRTEHPARAAEVIRRHIPIDALRSEAQDWSDFLRKLSARAEEVGILVLRTGIVGNNTHRPLDPHEVAGFAVADPVAPIILINTRDYVARRNFTFAHELAHVWTGHSVVDDTLERETVDRLERFCDEVAVNLLVPEALFRQVWGGRPEESVARAVRYFWVSAWVVARRARELGLIDQTTCLSLLDAYYSGLQAERPRAQGGNSDRNLLARNSPTFTKALLEAALRGDVSFKEAASLLNLSLSSFVRHLERQSDALHP